MCHHPICCYGWANTIWPKRRNRTAIRSDVCKLSPHIHNSIHEHSNTIWHYYVSTNRLYSSRTSSRCVCPTAMRTLLVARHLSPDGVVCTKVSWIWLLATGCFCVWLTEWPTHRRTTTQSIRRKPTHKSVLFVLVHCHLFLCLYRWPIAECVAGGIRANHQ